MPHKRVATTQCARQCRQKWDIWHFCIPYFAVCLEEAGDDAAFIAHALGVIARARGMTQLAKDTGLGRESLYKALSGEGNPSFATILKVIKALGLKLGSPPSVTA